MLIHPSPQAKIGVLFPALVARMHLFRFAAVLLLSCSLLACSTTRILNSPVTPQAAAGLKPGDTVEVTTTQGKRYRFEISRLTDHAIHSQRGAVAYKDIASMEVREFSGLRTAGAIGLGASIVLYSLALYAFYALGKGLERGSGNSGD